jgi:hypothetical protein
VIDFPRAPLAVGCVVLEGKAAVAKVTATCRAVENPVELISVIAHLLLLSVSPDVARLSDDVRDLPDHKLSIGTPWCNMIS